MSEPANNGDPPPPKSPPKGGIPHPSSSSRPNNNIPTSKSSPRSHGNPPRAPLVSTPARDPVAMVAKRMQHLQLHGSTSQLSPLPSSILSASSPMRTTVTPGRHHQYDLTPVMKNTSELPGAAGGVDLDLELDFDLDKLVDARCNGTANNNISMVSPDAGAAAGEGLHGEHLTLPDDLFKGGNVFANRPGHLPPLAKRGILPVNQRRGSTGGVPHCHGDWRASHTHQKETIPSALSSNDPPPPCTSVIRAPELAFFPEVEDPIPFPPSSGKSNTFTSMKQYEKQLQHTCTEQEPPMSGLRPYQPSRQDRGIVDIPQEALDSIFTARRTNSGDGPELGIDGTFSSTGPTATTYSEDADECPGQMSLFAAIPLEDRQWSIPSIRMANRLGGSIASCTTYTDEEDESLLHYRDDASLSSMGSYTNVLTLGGGDDIQGAAFVVTVTPDKQQQQQLCSFDSNEQPQLPFATNPPDARAFAARGQEFLQETEAFSEDTEDDIREDTVDVIQPPRHTESRYHQERRRQKRKEQRNRQAYEWLRQVKAGDDDVAEAASSKFLRSNAASIFAAPHASPLVLGGGRPMKRLSSAAVETGAFAFLAHQDSMEDHAESFHNILATS
ncbi:expressed unknown protein [Seminavis robusta]|uniref:Uncharacterized protein n=1 Tax=Seminavis robusta TaxID=568900 RepID=A0A9N8DBP5_9STRA|nr:expressed unknown protein [Seminavis robusta]|eukprot:Sro79_g042710.1 n/a (614) ;mRNA; f:52075-53916